MASVSDVGGGVQCVGPRYDDALIGRKINVVVTWTRRSSTGSTRCSLRRLRRSCCWSSIVGGREDSRGLRNGPCGQCLMSLLPTPLAFFLLNTIPCTLHMTWIHLISTTAALTLLPHKLFDENRWSTGCWNCQFTQDIANWTSINNNLMLLMAVTTKVTTHWSDLMLEVTVPI
jgi:hypothetical protein